MSKESTQTWLNELQEIEARWNSFIDKLQTRAKEFSEAAIPELEEAYESDVDEYRRIYHRLAGGIDGQLDDMLDKASEIYEDNIHYFYITKHNIVDIINQGNSHTLLREFRDRCSTKLELFKEQVDYWRTKIHDTKDDDLEVKYENILKEYEFIKDKFSCKQCGSAITIHKLFFTATHLECPSCKTQNTFKPSTQAQQLDHLARSLAEQRTSHLLKFYNLECNKERDLYHEIHTLSLSIIHEKDKLKLNQVNQKIEALQQERTNSIAKAPDLYRKYLRAMFDEWNSIVPDLSEQNERFYANMLRDFNKGQVN